METVTKKTVTNLTSDSVSILTQKFVTNENGASEQIGSNHRTSYDNSESGRTLFLENEPEDIVAEVLEVWGNAPTVETPDFSGYVPQPTLEERVSHLEEAVANGGGSTGTEVWDEMAAAIEEGVNEV